MIQVDPEEFLRQTGTSQAGTLTVSPEDFLRLDPTAEEVKDMVRSAAQRYGVEPEHLLKMAGQESRFRQSAISPKGAIGVMQLMPGTASQYDADPQDLYQNIDAGARYYRDLLKRFEGDSRKATAAYNFGPTRVAAGEDWPQETRDYVAAIFGKNGEPKSGFLISPEEFLQTPPREGPVVVQPSAEIPSRDELGQMETELAVLSTALQAQANQVLKERADLEKEAKSYGPDSQPEAFRAFEQKVSRHNLGVAQFESSLAGHQHAMERYAAGVAAFNENLKRYQDLKTPPGAEMTGRPGIPLPSQLHQPNLGFS
ncbi:MAG TPA: transglycosylase SLT domain-containing protein, partial [Bryobacteraceae bacterium]|nr:transglycosylase SLT domain-containing protein [Bryobacteraceae bacterium]